MTRRSDRPESGGGGSLIHSGGHRESSVRFGHHNGTQTKDPTMTNETMNLQELLEKTTDPDFLRQMICFTAQRLMALEVETLTGAEPGVRTPDRLNQRNGYRDRDWELSLIHI